MDAKGLYEAGQLSDAITTLTEEVKSRPTDLGLRTFLFELLSFAGQWDRAEKQLDVIGRQDAQLEPVAQAFRNILKAEQARAKLFSDSLEPRFLHEPAGDVKKHLQAANRMREGNFSDAAILLAEAEEQRSELPGEMDGTRFEEFRDCDDILSAVFELFIGEHYFWVPFALVKSIEIPAPEHPRDLLWTACQLELADGAPCRGFMPVRYAGSEEHEDDRIRLARMTDWKQSEEGPTRGVGHRMFLAGETDRGMLEVRKVVFETG